MARASDSLDLVVPMISYLGQSRHLVQDREGVVLSALLIFNAS